MNDSQDREPVEGPVPFIYIPNHHYDLDEHKDYEASSCKTANCVTIGRP